MGDLGFAQVELPDKLGMFNWRKCLCQSIGCHLVCTDLMKLKEPIISTIDDPLVPDINMTRTSRVVLI